MSKISSYASSAWLLKGMIHSLPGVLVLKEGTLRFTLLGSGSMGKRSLEKLAFQFNLPDLVELLEADQPVELFQVGRHSLQHLNFPWYYFGSGMQFGVGHHQFKLSFIQPNNTQIPARFNPGQQLDNAQGIFQARRIGQRWKEHLSANRGI